MSQKKASYLMNSFLLHFLDAKGESSVYKIFLQGKFWKCIVIWFAIKTKLSGFRLADTTTQQHLVVWPRPQKCKVISCETDYLSENKTKKAHESTTCVFVPLLKLHIFGGFCRKRWNGLWVDTFQPLFSMCIINDVFCPFAGERLAVSEWDEMRNAHYHFRI